MHTSLHNLSFPSNSKSLSPSLSQKISTSMKIIKIYNRKTPNYMIRSRICRIRSRVTNSWWKRKTTLKKKINKLIRRLWLRVLMCSKWVNIWHPSTIFLMSVSHNLQNVESSTLKSISLHHLLIALHLLQSLNSISTWLLRPLKSS